jgi:hypothetical protein
MAFPHSFRGSTSSSFNNVSRSILLFVRAPLRGALAGRARSSTQPLRRSRRREFETNGLSCFRLRSADSRRTSRRAAAIDTRRYPRRIPLFTFTRAAVRGIRSEAETLSILSADRAHGILLDPDIRIRFGSRLLYPRTINEGCKLLHASDKETASLLDSAEGCLAPPARVSLLDFYIACRFVIAE